MIGKVIDILKEHPFYVPKLLLKNYRNLNITDTELIILIYLINSDKTFNPKKISQDLNFKLNEIMDIINSLVEKQLIKIEIVNKKVREEIFNIDELYNKLSFIIINDKIKKSTNLFDIFEQEFGRTLSPMDYEIITDWQKDFDENYLQEIKYYCLIMTADYIENNFSKILEFENVIERRISTDINIAELIAENGLNLQMCKKYGLEYILIDKNYKIEIEL